MRCGIQGFRGLDAVNRPRVAFITTTTIYADGNDDDDDDGVCGRRYVQRIYKEKYAEK